MRHTRPVRLGALAAALIAAPAALTAVPAAAVTGPASDASDTTHAYTAQLTVGDHTRGCSGVLVDAEWLLTAASCFVDDPAQNLTVPSGAPKLKTTATIGRTDLTSTQGAQRQVVELVPRSDRDVVLARLSSPVTNVSPIALASASPAAGEELKFAGYGRSKTEWAPLKLHTGAYTVDSAAATTAAVTGKDSAACMGDSGGPVIRGSGTSAQLVGLNSQSWQGGCFGADATETRTGGVTSRVDDLGEWINSKTGLTPVTDFNGDGVEDIAIADPKASVGGKSGAGLVRIAYGGSKGTAEISQDLDWVPGGAEKDDWFGEQIATVDYNEDGYTDLVVGTPSEDLGGHKDVGMVDVLYGAPDGLGTGPVKNKHLEQGKGTGSIAASAGEAGDRMGQALAAGTSAEGGPWILIGLPGESIGSLDKAGMAFYVHGNTSATLHQDKPGVPGAAEPDDAFGSSVTGDAHHIAIGAPGEAIGSLVNSGNVALFSHKLDSAGRPTAIGGMDQNNDAISGGAEAGDEYGAALSMVDYRPSGAPSANESFLAIGSPGEGMVVNGANKANAGRVVLVRIDAANKWTYVRQLWQGTNDDDVAGAAEAGDRMGESLTAVNTAPHQVGSTKTMKLAVGTPGEAIGSVKNAGAIHTFSFLGAAGANDQWIEAGDGDGIPGTPGAGHRLGQSIHFTGTHLYAGMPYGPSAHGALHALPMPNVTVGDKAEPVTTHEPGKGGLPATGSRFGYAAR